MKELYLYLMFVLFVWHECHADTSGKEARIKKAMKYFRKYGYVDWYRDDLPAKVMAMVVKRFQFFSNLKVTGSLDDATLKQMDLPRCGLSDPDVHTVNDAREGKGYLAQGNRWDMSNNKKKELTWRVFGGGRRVTKEQTRRVMHQAFGIWEKHANIKFREVSAISKVDILVKYERLCHRGDPYCFDYKGGDLVHSFYPYPGNAISGDVHFDDDEDFSVGGKPGTDLLWVAVHALGHSLGLEHIHTKGSIMHPWPQGYKADPDLAKGDIQGIQDLYGSPVAQPKTKPRP